MRPETLTTQIKRLETQWPNSYGEQRVLLIGKAFQHVADTTFARAVDIALSEYRGAPLVPELTEAIARAEREAAQSRLYAGMGSASPGAILDRAAANNRTADPEFVKACTQLLRDKLNGKITQEQFLQGCDYLDETARAMSRQTMQDWRGKQAGDA